jgi:integrase
MRASQVRAEIDDIREATDEDRRALRAYLRRRGAGDGTDKRPDSESSQNALGVLNRMAASLGYVDAEHCPWSKLDYEDVQAIVDDLAERCTVESVNTYLGTLRGLATRAKKIGAAKSNPDAWDGILAFEPLTGEALRTSERDRVSYQEYAMLLACCDEIAKTEPQKGLRDKCLFKMLYLTGLRVGSISNLKLSSIVSRHVESGGATVAKWFVVIKGQTRAKRNKEHSLLLDTDLVETLQEYITLRGKWEGPLLVATSPGVSHHVLIAKPLGRRSIYTILEKYCEQAKIPMRSPHAWRRAFVTDLISVAGLRAAQVAVGHSSPSVTMLYDTEGSRRMEDAVAARHKSLQEREAKAGD